MRLDDFNFQLPNDLIAHYPLGRRSASRLLCLDGLTGSIAHKNFDQLVDSLHAGDLLVFNDTKVIPARLYGQKASGGRVELLVERILGPKHFLAQARCSKPLKFEDKLFFANNISFQVTNKKHHFYEFYYEENDRSVLEIIEAIGQIPLPPYISRSPEESDKERYQTIYAKHKGSMAAPTAGFHFDAELLHAIYSKNVQFAYVTLHIGAGTFIPVRVENIADHTMHSEYLVITDEVCAQVRKTKAQGKRVIAVGTTSLRALETACNPSIEPYEGETNIFIYPGYQFKCADALITNLHLPCSTLLMLVCAFGGYDNVMHAYQEAVKQTYRFYSYGDAMWVTARK